MYLKKLAFMAYIRLRNSNPATWDGIGKNRQIGHLQWLDRQHKSLDIPKWPIDSITPETDWYDKFCVDTESFATGKDISAPGLQMQCLFCQIDILNS